MDWQDKRFSRWGFWKYWLMVVVIVGAGAVILARPLSFTAGEDETSPTSTPEVVGGAELAGTGS